MLIHSPELGGLGAAVIGLAALAGAGLAWWIRRRTQISIRNVYLATTVLLMACALIVLAHAWVLLVAFLPASVLALSATIIGRRWRLSDLGAGEELRRHELARRWLWHTPPPARADERVFIGSQGEIVRERSWPAAEPYVPMTHDDRARIPRRSGLHVAAWGATGSGKTTSVLRAAAGRTMADHAALLVIDQKGDPPTEQLLRQLAAVTARPFILFDPRASDSDHWQPLWGDRPSEVVARALAGIQTSEPFYADVLRQHVTLIATVLHGGGYWPPSFPLLVDSAQLRRYPRVLALTASIRTTHPELWQRVNDHTEWVTSRDGKQALAGGLVRLDLAVGEAWRTVLAPRTLPDGQHVGVALTQAIKAGAIVLWRTHVDAMHDEAEAITAAALADIHASAIDADGAPWTVILDEFGAVVASAANQALALLQRGRTHNGQVYVVTQSTADIEALTGQPGLLASLSDNFAAFIVHRQTSPESRDWLAKLMGTTALWASTDQTSGHGTMHTGSGTRRRVREFRVSSDTFGELRTGEAVIHTTLGPKPIKVDVARLVLPEDRPVPRIDPDTPSSCEITVHPANQLPATPSEDTDAAHPSPVLPRERSRRRPAASASPRGPADAIDEDLASTVTPVAGDPTDIWG